MKYKHIVVSHYGGPDELRVMEDECPEPKRGEVRVVAFIAENVKCQDRPTCS